MVGAVLSRWLSDSIAKFQSLRGFGVGWSDVNRTVWMAGTLVSIPERVWGWLELVLMLVYEASRLVSIPERVWGWLEPGLPITGHGWGVRLGFNP